jgi:hemerythrin-like domain-containing protein
MTQQKQDNDGLCRDIGRRGFLSRASVMGVAVAMPAALTAQQRRGSAAKRPGQEDVAPPEDLMREHGVLKRVLLIYDEGIRRIESRQQLPPEPIKNSAQIIRSFIEDYHEKLEEEYLFPRFEKARTLTDLTAVLRAQHRAGRTLTAQIAQLATDASLKDPSSAATLRNAMRQFIRMYAPHEAREDTVLFPALRSAVSKNEFNALVFTVRHVSDRVW